MAQVRMKTGPYRGRILDVFDHEVGSLVATGQAERIVAVEPEIAAPAAVPEKVTETAAPERKKRASRKR